MNRLCMASFFVLFALYCVAYPIAVIGVAFDVQPPFSLAWAGSALLLLEGTLLLLAATLIYGVRRALLAGGSVLGLSYLVEALGVQTGFPFGPYHYTHLLVPALPGAVPLPVLFAWVLIIFGSFSIVKRGLFTRRGMAVGAALSGALLATLLDLAIEPVAAHVVGYWVWTAQGPLAYYGVPLANFGAWFVVAFGLLALMTRVLREERVQMKIGMLSRLPVLAPRLLFVASLLMFGLVDLTHGYYWAAGCALLGGILSYMIISPFPHRPPFSILPADRVK